MTVSLIHLGRLYQHCRIRIAKETRIKPKQKIRLAGYIISCN